MARLGTITTTAVGLVVAATSAAAFSSGPPDGRAGDPPAFSDCTQCHNEFDLNSGDGMLTLDGFPSSYEAETTYMLTVTIADPDQSRWGFEATAIAATNDEGGSFVSVDANTQVSGSAGDMTRDYVKQTFDGTQSGSTRRIVDVRVDVTGRGFGYG